MPEPRDVARRFARGLDDEDYATAAECLGAACEYVISGVIHRGPASILASYRGNADWAARTLDSIRYESLIRPGERGEVVVEFVDHLQHGGKALTHRCEQHLEFDESGLISRIRHVDLPGEREALDRFFVSVGLPRSRAAEDERPADSISRGVE